jgi:hypothetical protein
VLTWESANRQGSEQLGNESATNRRLDDVHYLFHTTYSGFRRFRGEMLNLWRLHWLSREQIAAGRKNGVKQDLPTWLTGCKNMRFPNASNTMPKHEPSPNESLTNQGFGDFQDLFATKYSV